MIPIIPKQPALTDDDLMPFGQHAGKPMKQVPAEYLSWLKSANCGHAKVANYIHNSWNAIKTEMRGRA